MFQGLKPLKFEGSGWTSRLKPRPTRRRWKPRVRPPSPFGLRRRGRRSLTSGAQEACAGTWATTAP